MSILREFANGKWGIFNTAAALVAIGLFSLSPCAKKPEPVTQGTVPVQLTAIGNGEAYSTIQVRSQIGGELMKVHFREGQDVNRGALLFTIDPRPYES